MCKTGVTEPGSLVIPAVSVAGLVTRAGVVPNVVAGPLHTRFTTEHTTDPPLPPATHHCH